MQNVPIAGAPSHSQGPARAADRPGIDPAPAAHALAAAIAGRSVNLAVGGDPEVAKVVAAAYRVAVNDGQWDPGGGRTTLDRPTIDRAASLGRLLADAGRADYEHGIAPGPVVTFTGPSLLLDLRFGDPDDDARTVVALAQEFAELGLSLDELGGEGAIVSGGS